MSNKVPFKIDECCGCGKCYYICPKKAIEMVEDKEGFVYPLIDSKKCVDCGICYNNCQFLKANRNNNQLLEKCYIAKHKDLQVRMNSRSGGIFVAISDIILNDSGVIYGCVLRNNRAIHVRATNKTERDEMCKSKYIQSNILDSFESLKKDLLERKTVLYSGTACQIDAIKSFLENEKVCVDKLYTLDIVCHGCPSPKLFLDYIDYIEEKSNQKVENFEFRDKSACGWDGHIETYFLNEKKYKSTIWREIFHTDACIRPSCYNCKYASTDHPSDITIADAWGIKTALPSFNDNRGVSMMLSQTSKGDKMINKINDVCEIKELDIGPFMQKNLYESSKSNVNRKMFWDDYENGGIKLIIKKYGRRKLRLRLKDWVKYRIRKIVKKDYYLP